MPATPHPDRRVQTQRRRGVPATGVRRDAGGVYGVARAARTPTVFDDGVFAGPAVATAFGAAESGGCGFPRGVFLSPQGGGHWVCVLDLSEYFLRTAGERRLFDVRDAFGDGRLWRKAGVDCAEEEEEEGEGEWSVWDGDADSYADAGALSWHHR